MESPMAATIFGPLTRWMNQVATTARTSMAAGRYSGVVVAEMSVARMPVQLIFTALK